MNIPAYVSIGLDDIPAKEEYWWLNQQVTGGQHWRSGERIFPVDLWVKVRASSKG